MSYQCAFANVAASASAATASIATYRIDPRVVSGFGGTGAADGASAAVTGASCAMLSTRIFGAPGAAGEKLSAVHVGAAGGNAYT